MARFPEEVQNDVSTEWIETQFRIYVRRASPTPGFRRRAWREFQRALDPLATPKPLESIRADRPVSSDARTD
jgi:hypothetical protein